MAQVYSIDGTPITNRVRTTAGPSGVDGLPSSAWYGEAMIAGVTIEDPLGELDLMGWHTFTHDETACTGSERTFTGWITGKDISRGEGRQATGASRIWDCEIIDQNAVWKLKLFRAASAQRPAETDNARMAFMLASAPMAATPVADNGRWNTTDNPVNFGAASFVAQYPIDLANSVAGTSGKNFYAYWDDAAGEISGHYDLVTANPLSTIAISNVIADQDSTTVYPLIDAVLTRSPEDQVNGVLYRYLGDQYVYVQDTDLFGPGEFSPVNFDRDVLYSTDRVGLLATANAQAAAQLSARAAEKDTLTVTVLLDPDQVNLLHAGMRVASRFTHLPGYEAEGGVELAVIRRNVIPPTVRGMKYTVRLELSNSAAPTGPGGGDPGEFPPEPVTCDLAWVQSSNINVNSTNIEVILPFTPTIGNTVVLDFGMRTTGLIIDLGSAWTDLTGVIGFAPSAQDFAVQRFYKVWDADDVNPIPFDFDGSGGSGGDNNFLRCLATELSGAMTPFVTDTESTDVNYCAPPTMCGTVTVDSGTSVLLLGVASIARNVSSSNSFTPNGSATEAVDISQGSRVPMWLGYEITTGTGSGQSMSAQIVGCPGNAANGYGGILTAFVCSGGDTDTPCLSPGQPSPEDEAVTPAADGTTTTFSTRCPFADNTLHVKVDNTNQDGAIASYDGAAGTFTFNAAPHVGMAITVNYIGR